MPYAADVDGRGAVTIAFDRLLDILTQSLDGLAARTGRDLERVAGVGMSAFLHSIAGLDAGGRPVTPILTWADTTSAAAAAELRARVDAATLWQATGAPIHASYWPAKIARLREFGDAGTRVRRFAGAPDLLWRALTGEWGIDLSLASGTGLLDRASATWHEGLLRLLDIAPADLPPIRAHRAAAPLARWAAERWPALAAVPWFVPWSDASCGNLGVGGVAGGPAALQVGTSGALRIVLADPAPRVPPGLFAHRLADGTALLGGQLSEGGGTAAAVARLLGGTPRTLETAAAALPPDGHGLTVLPFLAGERGPGYHASARGVVSGLTLASTPAELYLATLEAIALRFAAIDRRLSAHLGAAPAVVASGGAVARSRLLPELLAAALGRPIEQSREGEASARGAALQVLAAVGVVAAPSDVPPPPSRRVLPDRDRAAVSAAAGERQAALYERLLGEA